tara:strand:+ start:50 stop:700 length:651 start_codon:yes stop_codon:yes gene_type:complete
MKKELILTNDGSHSLFVKKLNETYHSIHGSITEANHVFIRNGLQFQNKLNINILEIGFGTGLNALLTLLNLNQKRVNYTSLEPFPISDKIYKKLNFYEILKSDKETFIKLHNSDWEVNVPHTDNFNLNKLRKKIQYFNSSEKFDIIYFDAFAPEKQSEMWSIEVLNKCYYFLKPKGFLVTYCAKGVVKRTLKEVGFLVESLEGPPGKREMIRAFKK